jgi:hypothetical protein
LGAFRRLLQRAPFYAAYKRLCHYPDYWYWNLRGRPARSPHLVKQRTVLEYAEKYGLTILIETGTYYGEMVAAMRKRFERIDSIESDPYLAQRAAKEFAHDPHIRILEGDSRTALPALLKSVGQPALFWLDAGYYGWAGDQGERARLSDELEAILHHRVEGHVILMDDARRLDGSRGGFTLDGLKSRVESEFPGRAVEVKYDILCITPIS